MSKRLFDFLAAFWGLLLLSPLFAAIALLIKFDSRGPVFFKQIRVGRNFRPFHLYKFRTMVPDAYQRGGELTVGLDPRVTRVGQVLRQFKLDELPQLYNVLKGDMSLVGPRPEVPFYVEKFKEDYLEVLKVRPGLTDLASLKFIDEQGVLGKAANPEEEYTHRILPEKIRLAKLYIEHGSFLFDLAVIGQTLLQIFSLRTVILTVKDRENQDEVAFFEYSTALLRYIWNYRWFLTTFVDLSMVVLANYCAFWLRFDGDIPSDNIILFIQTLPLLLLIRAIAFKAVRLNEGLWRYVSLWDLRNILISVFAGTMVFYGVIAWGFELSAYPRSVFIIDSVLLVGFLCGVRVAVRVFEKRKVLRKNKRVLIIGAGDAGEKIVREMQTHSRFSYRPVGFVDDDQAKWGKRIHGIKVLGGREILPSLLHSYHLEEVLVAMPGANPAILQAIITALEPFKVPIKTLPNLRDILDGKITITQIRDFAVEDLLQRSPVGLNHESVLGLLKGKRVLVTGAGGSIGSELCRQIAACLPDRLVLYERHENSLYKIYGELTDRGILTGIHAVLGDVTDPHRLHSVMSDYSPDIIFHAAAHKHVPLMEINPCEAFKNNVVGTRMVAEAAQEAGVERFVLISTDKAVNPSSVMGATKRVAELVVQSLGSCSQTRFLTVRFGNVLGSSGSVVLRFQDQIKNGGPVTVTHPEVRRYFMSIPEAVTLVLHAAAIGERGGTYILEMGQQIKLLDLARNMIRLAGKVPEIDVPIQFVGLRLGEKLEEELVGQGEIAQASPIEKILKIQSKVILDQDFIREIPLNVNELGVLGDSSAVIAHLKKLVPNFLQREEGQSAGTGQEVICIAGER